ncbi:MAG: beta-N-acetylhexosaminidase, partial [Thermoleophilia bacterium]|nr:beta-N-acetylhexosaminidase [Thermoleophilia bacterium]
MEIRRPLARTAVIAALLLVAAGCGSDSSTKSGEPSANTTTSTGADRIAPPDQDPELAPGVNETHPSADPTTRLSIADLAGELVMTKLEGPSATAEELAAVRDGVVGNIVLFGPNVVDAAQLTALTESLDQARQAKAAKKGLATGVIVSVDQEGGSIRNIPFSPPESTQPEIAARGDVTEPRA